MIQKIKVEKTTSSNFPTSGEYAFIPEGDLRKLLIPLDKVILLENNPRENEEAAKKLAVLIKANGFRKPIVLNEDLEVKAGNTAVKACRILGMKSIPGVRSAWLSKEKEWNYVLSDNKANEYAEWDNKKLAKLMSDGLIQIENTGHGFTERELFKISNFAEIKYREGEDGEEIDSYLAYSKENILNNLFTEFREKGFPFPNLSIAECKQEINKLTALPSFRCLRSTLGYKVADTFHHDRYDSSAVNMLSPLESFAKDESLKKALRMQMESSPNNIKYRHFGFLNLVNGTQACSNFRPAFAKMLYNEYAPKDGVVFDPSTGYGGRLVGFLASHCKVYIGVDPSYRTCESNRSLWSSLQIDNKDVIIENFPIEDVDIVGREFNNCDFAFTSPPYFAKEKYDSCPNQSWRRYTDYEKWKLGFLRSLFGKVNQALKPGKLFLVNIEDVKIGERIYPLVEDTIIEAGKVGFTLEDTKYFELQDRTKKTEEEGIISEYTKESVLFFRSGGAKIQKVKRI